MFWIKQTPGYHDVSFLLSSMFSAGTLHEGVRLINNTHNSLMRLFRRQLRFPIQFSEGQSPGKVHFSGSGYVSQMLGALKFADLLHSPVCGKCPYISPSLVNVSANKISAHGKFMACMCLCRQDPDAGEFTVSGVLDNDTGYWMFTRCPSTGLQTTVTYKWVLLRSGLWFVCTLELDLR